MGTRLRRRRKTRIEKIEESKGKTSKRLRNELNQMVMPMKECGDLGKEPE